MARSYDPLPIPARAGIGFRPQHIDDFLTAPPDVAWIEVHAENYFVEGGPRIQALEKLRQTYPLSIHGVGLSLASTLKSEDVAEFKVLVDKFEPGLISEHLAWTADESVYYNDLLPFPYTEETLETVCQNIDRVQSALGRKILVENPSTYLRFKDSTIPEWEFLREVTRRSGCGLLLDVNNVHITSTNHTFDSEAYISELPLSEVGEIHVAGHTARSMAGQTLLIDDHAGPVSEPVWELFRATLKRIGPCPTLVEWDNNVPPLASLLEQASIAENWLNEVRRE